MTPELRLGLLEWAFRSGRGELPGLDWVDATVLSEGQPFTVVRTPEGVKFRHVPYGRYLPPPMVDAAREAQAQGDVPALEVLLALFARAEWLVATRGWFWTPQSPVPRILASLVEAYGIDQEVHGFDADTLSRAIAELPTWYPRRGEAAEAAHLLDDVFGIPSSVRIEPPDTAPREELFACRSAAWHAARPHRTPPLRIERGFVRAMDVASPPVSREDVLVGWIPGDRIPHQLLRLLPAWASVRLHPRSPS